MAAGNASTVLLVWLGAYLLEQDLERELRVCCHTICPALPVEARATALRLVSAVALTP